ncbi:class I SAM-dependent methyltransferase [Sphingobium sp. EM0848]|uniref:class I SAM-dependent methyltransferase n=1 Tax=Sphingobium sp. EM0848 TaxID=2743473 RepID=UPI00159C8EAA|nr:class I SAM-dependent methyltransferase [Sphingobium sp. EM0848]
MIVPKRPSTAAGVAMHYDELDLAYRRIWGEHVHHGYWRTGRESPAEAADALVEEVERRLALEPGQTLCDIGCGYGATAARIAARHDVSIIGLTLSSAQEKVANARPPSRFTCLQRDWLHNDLPDASFDRAYAIESSEHMVDKARFFREAARVLRPGGRLVVCAWLEGKDAHQWQIRHLLEPICREGRLPSMGSRADYEALAVDAGFILRDYEDVSSRVRRTWTICLRRFAGRMITDPALRRLALSSQTRNRDFIFSLPRLILALRTRAMRYGIFVWSRN